MLLFCLTVSAAIAANGRDTADLNTNRLATISMISLAPSPYTLRHDSTRAGYGIYYFLHRFIKDYELPLSATYYDGTLSLGNRDALGKMTSSDVLVIGSSVWSQGSARYARQFFEDVGAGDWLGQSVSAWATAGGQHTGGSVLIADTLRSAMGLGARVFSLGQKYMVFSTDERVGIEDHYFSLLDLWFMEQFACAIAVEALTHIGFKTAEDNTSTLGCFPHYYTRIPKTDGGLDHFAPLAEILNSASDPESEEWEFIRSQMANHSAEDCKAGCSSAANDLQPFSAHD